jgi:hypothetical protein
MFVVMGVGLVLILRPPKERHEPDPGTTTEEP